MENLILKRQKVRIKFDHLKFNNDTFVSKIVYLDDVAVGTILKSEIKDGYLLFDIKIFSKFFHNFWKYNIKINKFFSLSHIVNRNNDVVETIYLNFKNNNNYGSYFKR